MKKAWAIFVLVTFCIPLSAQQPATPANTNSITVLYDSIGPQKNGTIQDWGYAAFIRYNDKNILFDTGMDPDILEHNAKALGIDLAKVDFVVLSHSHNDHAAGFPYFLKVNSHAKIYLPDDATFFAATGALIPGAHEVTTSRPPEEQHYRGQKPQLQMKPAGMFAGRSDVVAVEENSEITPGLFIIHTTSPLTGRFSAYPPNSPEKPAMDGLPELSLAIKTPHGVVLITGCSHSKVENIVTATREFTGSDIDLLEGGFHLIGYDREYVTSLANTMKNKLRVRRVGPTHCTGEIAESVFREVYAENYVAAGLESVVRF